MSNVRRGNYGQGFVVLEEDKVNGGGVDPMRLLSRLTAPDYQPPLLPTVALELLALSRKPSIGIRDIAVLWDLPQELRLVLAHHLAFGATEPVHPLAAVTYLAEQLAIQFGAAFADENEGLFVNKAIAELRITDVQFQHLEQVARETVTQLT
jgi:HD-like signal output (HDOD) protein